MKDPRLNIAYVAEGRLNSFMADTTHILQTIDAYRELGHQVKLFARSGDLQPNTFNVKYGLEHNFSHDLIQGRDWPQPWRRISRLLNSLAIAREVRRSGSFDLILGREVYVLGALYRSGIPIIVEAHEMISRFQRPIFRRLIKHNSFFRLIVITTSLQDEFFLAFPELPAEKVKVVPNGVPKSRVLFPSSQVKMHDNRSMKRLKVGYVGALYQGKGMEIVLPLASAMPDLEFHIVGGRQSDVEFWRKDGASSNIIFHGHKERSKIFSYLDAFDIAILPSQIAIRSFSGAKTDYGRWTSPMKLFDYMARGLPILASDLPGIRDVVDDEISALLVPPDDIEAWKNALVRLRDDASLRSRLGAAARASCEANFTTIARAESTLEGLF